MQLSYRRCSLSGRRPPAWKLEEQTTLQLRRLNDYIHMPCRLLILTAMCAFHSHTNERWILWKQSSAFSKLYHLSPAPLFFTSASSDRHISVIRNKLCGRP